MSLRFIVARAGIALALLGACAAATAQPGPVVVWGESDPLWQAPAGNYWAVTGGGTYAAGIREDRTLTVWGPFIWAPLASPPSGTFQAIDGGTLYCVGIRTDGTLAAWGDPSFGLTNPPQGTFTKVSASEHHAAAVRTDGTIEVWGAFGVPTPSGQFIDVAVGQQDFCIGLRADGTLVGWGANTSGQLNVPSGQFVSVVAGDHWGAALRADGVVAFWGGGGGSPALLSGTVTAITANYFSLVGLRDNGSLTATSINPPTPGGLYQSISAGNTTFMAVIPSPATVWLCVLSTLPWAGRRRTS